MTKKGRYFTDKRILFFVIVLGIFTLIFWVAAAKTEWKSTPTSFFRWQHDTFDDWFTELYRTKAGPFTGDSIGNYPALCFLILKFFREFIPEHDGQVYDVFSLRATQSAAITFFIFMIVLIFALYFIFRYQMREKNIYEREGMAIALLSSAPYIFEFERGNLIIIALVCTFLYLTFYDSEKKGLRLISYICLSVAAAIKLYPAIFGILTPLKKRYRETVILVFMGAVTFFLPFFAFGGIDACIAFFKSIMGSFDFMPATYGFGYDFSIYNLERIVLSIIDGYQTAASNVSIIVVAIALILAFICNSELWKRLCVLSLAIVLLPKFSYLYTLCFLAFPLLCMLKCSEKRIHYLYLCEFLLIYIPYIHIPIDTINYMTGEEASHLLGVGHIFMYVGLLSLLITLLIDGICCMIKKEKTLDVSPVRRIDFG